MSDQASIAANLGRIHALGVQLAIDDFGTGYSSLSYLRRLPARTLKVDRSFVSALDEDDSVAAIISAIVNMGHALGLTVIAEGVEHAGQAERLQLLGCDAAQGYLFARPRPARECARYFASTPVAADEALSNRAA
jgi:EAL domain-containing protein (putative c-di-GMP-specific phosphodiesterase class I)